MKGIRIMDIKKLTKILIGVGILVIAGALFWWATFYNQIAGASSSGLPTGAFRCLYSSGGPCAIVVGIARISGVTPYNPTLFWSGIIIFGVGLILKYSLKEEIPRSGNNKEDIPKK